MNKKIRSPRLMDYVLLIVLAAMLGSSFVLMKIAVQSIPTLTTVFFRLVTACVILIIYMSLRGIKFPVTERRFFWSHCVLLGVTANIVPFSLITWAEETINSNLASLYMATIPIFSIVMAHVLSADEKITGKKLAGMGVSVFGTAYLLFPAFGEFDKGLLAQLACLLSAVFYAFSRVKTKKLSHMDPIATSAGVLLSAIVVMFVFLVGSGQFFLSDPAFRPTADSILAVVLLGIFPTALAYVILYGLIADVGAVFMTSVNYMVPVFGIIWGSLILADHPGSRLLLSMALIVIGLWLSLSRVSLGRRFR